MKANALAAWHLVRKAPWLVVGLVSTVAAVPLILLGQWQWATQALLVALISRHYAEPKPLKPNQAVVTARVEPSADARQWASQVTQLRIALLNEGMSPEAANATLEALMRAAQGGAS